MAYQKLQAGKAWSVYPSDNTNIPNIGVVGPSGNTDATGGANKYLIDGNRTGADTNNFATLKFTLCGLKKGMIIVNSTDGSQSELVAVINDTTIEVKDAIFAAQPKAYAIYGGVQEGAVLYVGGTGNIKITTVAGDDVTLTSVPTGSFVPVQTVKIFSTGTTATNIVALW